MASLKIDSNTAALVLIDLQKDITARPTAPLRDRAAAPFGHS